VELAASAVADNRPAPYTQPMLPILYSFRRCPYAIRARSAVVASGVAVELREIVLRDKPAAMLAASPKGTVPVLVLPTAASSTRASPSCTGRSPRPTRSTGWPDTTPT
jgi:glutaredoxin